MSTNEGVLICGPGLHSGSTILNNRGDSCLSSFLQNTFGSGKVARPLAVIIVSKWPSSLFVGLLCVKQQEKIDFGIRSGLSVEETQIPLHKTDCESDSQVVKASFNK